MSNDADPGEKRNETKNRDAAREKERSTLERIVPELLRRVIETGTKNISPETIQKLVGELKVPKEALQHTFAQLDETKSGVYRVIAKELQDLFDRTNLADELAKALSSLSLEVKMEVRFKPNKSEDRDSRPSPATHPLKANDEK